jgi:hypothetical protein
MGNRMLAELCIQTQGKAAMERCIYAMESWD